MTYFEGFVVAVPSTKKDAFRAHAAQVAAITHELGVRRQVEAWADDVPHGTVTDFYRAVDARDDETIVFAWFEYASKQARDKANEQFGTDARMEALAQDVPFDTKRMILGGFQSIVEAGNGPGNYINGFVAPVPRDKKDAYRAMTERHAEIFREHGALRLVQAWGDDVPEGKATDFYRAVAAKPNETVVFAFIEWPSKQVSAEAWDKIMKDERMKPDGEVPFDGKRMFWGGFDVLVDTASETITMTASIAL